MKNKGQGLVEYALILVLIAIIVIGMVTLVSKDEHGCGSGYIYSEQENACLKGYRSR